MHIERMHKMIECLTEKALSELENGTENIDTCEFGAVVDMIKNLNEAEYRAVIVKSMKKADEEEEEYNKELLKVLKAEYGEEGGRRYYDHYRYSNGRFAPKGKGTYRRGYEEMPYYMPFEVYGDEYYRDMDRPKGRMYYTEGETRNMSNMVRDGREGKSGMSRRAYMETKEMHKGNTPEDKTAKMKELERYTKELAEDVTEMITDMTAEEKALLKSKMQMLMQKM